MKIFARAIAVAIVGYQRIVSPYVPAACRFHPTCSQYAKEAVLKHGVMRGVSLGIGRILRCNPWNPGGVDLVP